MGLTFRFRRTKCTGRIKDKPVLELRWTTEEGTYALEDLIAGDLNDRLSDTPVPQVAAIAESSAPLSTPRIIEVDLTRKRNAANIKRATTKLTPEAAYILDRRV